MRNENTSRRIIYIGLPLVLALMFNLSPLPVQYLSSLRYAKQLEGFPLSRLRAVNLQMAASFFPWRGDLWEQAGTDFATAGDPTAAIIDLQKALQLGQLSITGKLTLGDELLQNGNSQAALDIWNIVLASIGPSEDIYRRILHTYILEQDYAAAFEIFLTWNGWGESSANDIYQLGLYWSTVEPDQASGILTSASNLDTDLKPDVRIIQAGINSSNTGDPMSYRLLLVGRALGSINRWDIAEQAFRTACQLSPDYPEAWALLGEAQNQEGKDGLASLKEAIRLKPDSIFIQALLSLYYENHGKPDLALPYLLSIADQEPDNGVWQVEIGNAMAQTGDLVSALSYFQQAVLIDPDDAAFWRDLAAFSITYNVQTDDVGLSAARKAVALEPSNATGLDLLGQFLLNYQDLASAERMFLRAIQKDPKYALAQFHLGMTFLEEGKRDAAYTALTVSLSLSNGQPLEAQIKRVLEQQFP